MAGYVAQMVQKKTSSSACHEAVGSRQHKSESAFLTFERQGKFVQASRECHRSMHLNRKVLSANARNNKGQVTARERNPRRHSTVNME